MSRPSTSFAAQTRVLWTSSDPTLHSLVKEVLVDLGLEMDSIEGSGSALARVRESQSAMAIIDGEGVGALWKQVLSQIREAGPVTTFPILILRSLPDEGFVEEAFRLGANDVLRAPIRRPELRARVLMHLDMSRSFKVLHAQLADLQRTKDLLEVQAQEKLAMSEKQALIAELAGTAAHELNQPLTSVLGYAELLKRKLDPNHPVFQAVDVILREAERMAHIVKKIGKITRYETKSYVGTQKILDLDKASGVPEPDCAIEGEEGREI